jgi:hypothetical protein
MTTFRLSASFEEHRGLAAAVVLLAILLVLEACSLSRLFPTEIKGYEGPERPDAELAVISQAYGKPIADILKVTAKGQVVYAGGEPTPIIRLLPGEYGILYQRCGDTRQTCVLRSDVVQLEAGHVYVARGLASKSVWIVDETTDEVIAGTESAPKFH